MQGSQLKNIWTGKPTIKEVYYEERKKSGYQKLKKKDDNQEILLMYCVFHKKMLVCQNFITCA